MGKKKNLVGLDLGSSAIKVVELSSRSKKHEEVYELIALGYEPLPHQAIVEGTIMDSASVSDAIKKLFAELKIKNNNVATSISGSAVSIKRIPLPLMSPEELEESIQWEAKHHISLPIEDVNLDYYILSTYPEQGKMEILLTAARKERINLYSAAIAQAGKNVTLMDVDGLALQNAFEANYEMYRDRVVVLINIGASTTNINIVASGIPLLVRDIFFGGNYFTDLIQKEFSLTFDKAESLKRGNSVDGISPAVIQPLIQIGFSELRKEIAQTFDFLRLTYTDKRIERIILSGGSSKLPGLQSFLSKEFDCSVELFNPFRNIHFSERLYDRDFLMEMAPVFSVAVGLALRKIGD
ncbi:MAG: type IV pilus assembly protein PilM [Candidatus Aminicenantia bacterium]